MKAVRILYGKVILCLLVFELSAQEIELNGEYRHNNKGEFYSMYHFDTTNFTLIQSGDLGVFYGKEKYKIDKGLLILNFDTDNLDKKKITDYSIIQPKVDSLIFRKINKRTFGIRYTLENGRIYIERYRKINKSH